MKPAPFDYYDPTTVEETLELARPVRRRGETARGRPEPDADAEPPAGPPEQARRHQRRHRTGPSRHRRRRPAHRRADAPAHLGGRRPARRGVVAPAAGVAPRRPRAHPQPRHRRWEHRPRRPRRRAARRVLRARSPHGDSRTVGRTRGARRGVLPRLLHHRGRPRRAADGDPRPDRGRRAAAPRSSKWPAATATSPRSGWPPPWRSATRARCAGQASPWRASRPSP